ncbi:hypothetical protein [uncultured Shewanella sp.]|uniref:hypothetical protein n=1 Tax=Shewanella atlantica TaxID=271099 RepID=UPI0026154553|nr:hypothetical protein [uncultured Shewanella sp.]
MRQVVKLRLLFFSVAIICYASGFQFLPETLKVSDGQLISTAFAALYFIFLPLLYWLCIIKLGGQKLWKLLLIFSLSLLMARLSFPIEIAEHFEFILWLRFPIIAVLLGLELFLMVSIIKALWQARSLSGDPRINILKQFGHEDERKRSLALALAMEPASWFYAIPRFSRNHAPSIAHINLLSSSRWHWLLLTVATVLLAGGSYLAIQPWSEITAIIVSSFVIYGLILIAANHRVSRHFSVYRQEDQLIINNGVWGFSVVKFEEIQRVIVSPPPCENRTGVIHFGQGESSNILLKFNRPLTYFGGLGWLCEEVRAIGMVVDKPETLADLIFDISDERDLMINRPEYNLANIESIRRGVSDDKQDSELEVKLTS